MRKDWRPPPGWPTPPANWVPPADWQPDPSWPPAPPGWQFWRRRRPRAHVVILGAIGAFVMVTFIGLLAVDIISQQRGCGSVDPTDPANYTEAVIRNDTSEPVLLTDCHGTYCMAPGLDPIPPGATLGVRGACAASGADMTSYRVTTLDGAEVGYIAIDTPRKRDGATFDISNASEDRQTPTSSQ